MCADPLRTAPNKTRVIPPTTTNARSRGVRRQSSGCLGRMLEPGVAGSFPSNIRALAPAYWLLHPCFLVGGEGLSIIPHDDVGRQPPTDPRFRSSTYSLAPTIPHVPLQCSRCRKCVQQHYTYIKVLHEGLREINQGVRLSHLKPR